MEGGGGGGNSQRGFDIYLLAHVMSRLITPVSVFALNWMMSEIKNFKFKSFREYKESRRQPDRGERPSGLYGAG